MVCTLGKICQKDGVNTSARGQLLPVLRRQWPSPGGWGGPCPVPLGTSPVAIAEVWETPDVAQAHGIAHARQYKLDLVAPVAPSEVLVLLGGLAGHSTILWGQERSYHQ